MSGYRDLERQLRESVRRRATARAFSPRRWRSPRMAIALAPLALIGGVATAATQLGHGGGDEDGGRKLAFQAVKDTRHAPACRVVDTRDAPIVDDAPPPEFAAILPELATAPSRPVPSEDLAFARRHAGRAILGRTLRLVPVGGGRRLLVFVAFGGPFTVIDPKGCLRARQDRVAVLAPNTNDPVRKAAERALAELRDTMPDAQMLNLLVLPPGHSGPSFGAGMELESRAPLPRAIVVYGSGVYVGIAKPGATSITLRPAGKGTRSGIRRRVAVHYGLFAFSLPRHTGPVVLTQRAADGHALGSERIRE
jgi:hypothetical protein